MDFDDKLKEAFKREFDSIEFSEEARIRVKDKANVKSGVFTKLKNLLNYEIEIPVGVFAAACILIVVVPTILGFIDVKNNEKEYLNTRMITKLEEK